MPTFLHAADLHLDSPLRGLSARDADVGSRVRNATRTAFRNLIQRAIDEDVRFVVLSGDLFDDTHQSIDTALFLNAELKRLVDRSIGVFLVRGNHDHLARPSAVLLPPGVHQFESARASTVTRPDWGVALHGQSFSEQRVETDLTDGYPAAVSGLLNVGLLHTALEGRTGPQHHRYAPTTAGKLASLGYAYWALGHVHTRDVFRERQAHIAYPGNIQGRHINEEGAKGALLVDWEGTEVVSVRPFETDVIRWHEIVVERPGGTAHDRDPQLRALAEAVADETRATRHAGKTPAVRLVVRGGGPELVALSRETLRGLLRQVIATSCGDDVLLEEVRLTASEQALLPSSLRAPLDRIVTALESAGDDGEDARFVREIWERVNVACGPEVAPTVWRRLGVEKPDDLRRLLLDRGRERLIAQLAEA